MSCFNDRPTSRQQNPESDGNGKTTLEKGGRNPPVVTLDHIAEDLLHFKGFEYLNITEKKIEKKYDIKKEHDCWPDDDIKRAWGKTQRMNKKEREKWATVVIFQIVKRSLVQSKADDGLCSTDRPAERSYQSNAEQKTAGADEWLFGEGLKQFHCKLTEESGPASESQLSTAISDVASSSELKRKKCDVLVNENENALFEKCEKQKNIGYYKLRVEDDKETERWVDGHQSAVDIEQDCGKAQRERNQSNNVMETMGPAEGDEQHSGPNPTTYGTETPFADSNPSRHHTGVSENMPIDETIYIPIPLSVMFNNEQRLAQECPNAQSTYKLMNGAPSNVPLRKKKSYVMSFNNITRNAEWVYEILNRETLVNNCVTPGTFGEPYHRGHLAAAANHRWCWEALNDANLNSNIIPQHKTLNTGLWKKLENGCRNRIGQPRVHNVHVYSGPLYYRPKLEQMNPRIIEGKLVPTHLFKVIIVENVNGTVEEPKCFVVPNDVLLNPTLREYSVNIDFIERVSGLTFIEHRNVAETERIVTATLQGEGVNSTLQSVNIGVRIRS